MRMNEIPAGGPRREQPASTMTIREEVATRLIAGSLAADTLQRQLDDLRRRRVDAGVSRHAQPNHPDRNLIDLGDEDLVLIAIGKLVQNCVAIGDALIADLDRQRGEEAE